MVLYAGKGDRVRLYFPSEDADEAYVLNAMHFENGAGGQRTNPETSRSEINREKRFYLNRTQS